jgi:phosphonate transport system permease protein
MSESLRLLGSFFPPDLDPAYIFALLGPVGESLGLTLAAMTFAFLISLPLGVVVAVRVPGAAWLVSGLSLFRAIPDLTLAILCVILFGIGPGAGMIALILYYTAAVAKVFADLLQTAPRRPLDALQATGATRLQLTFYGLLPLTRNDLLSYGAFAFECALRSSIIVGAVGGGGIGAELVGCLAAFDLRRASTVILLLVLLVAILDRVALWLRDRPRWLPLLAPAGAAAAWIYGPELFALDHALGVFAEMLPPALPWEAVRKLPEYVWETVWMALAGTLGAALAAVPLAIAASRALSPAWLTFGVRRLLELLRTVPEIVWALVLVAVVGIGPVSGAAALALHSLGSLGRLFADAFDNAPAAPRDAIAGVGAGRLVTASYAVVPTALGPLATHMLFRLEWNLRVAAVLGAIGAGGIGQALYEAQQLFFYDQVLAYILVTAALILVTDRVSASIRASLRVEPIWRRAVPAKADGALAI